MTKRIQDRNALSEETHPKGVIPSQGEGALRHSPTMDPYGNRANVRRVAAASK